jgi:hypothetical protein
MLKVSQPLGPYSLSVILGHAQLSSDSLVLPAESISSDSEPVALLAIPHLLILHPPMLNLWLLCPLCTLAMFLASSDARFTIV